MNRKRLLILKRKLIAVAANPGNLKFDLDQWASMPEEYYDDAVKAVEGALAGDNYCGTTACACGVAATIPSFKRDGLRLVWANSLYYAIQLMYKGETAGAAAAEFFDLRLEEVDYLFVPEKYPVRKRKDPMAVVERIDEVLAGKFAEARFV